MKRPLPAPATAGGGPLAAVRAARWVPAHGTRRRRASLSLKLGTASLLLIVLLAVGAGLLTANGPDHADVGASLAAPGSSGHLLGTDALGRDLLTRILYGTRLSLLVAGAGMIGSLLLGVSAGMLAAFGGRWSERVVRWTIDAQLAFPYVLLAIAITSVLTPSPAVLVLLMVLSGWAAFARVVRSTALAETSRDYVKAATLTGASRVRIARKYVLPQLLPAILVLAAMQMAAMVVFEATLSYLGMGIQPPAPSWGRIMLEGQNYLRQAWWIATLPGIMILWLTISLSLIADGLQQRFRARIVGVDK